MSGRTRAALILRWVELVMFAVVVALLFAGGCAWLLRILSEARSQLGAPEVKAGTSQSSNASSVAGYLVAVVYMFVVLQLPIVAWLLWQDFKVRRSKARILPAIDHRDGATDRRAPD
jgi:hypothetical protein